MGKVRQAVIMVGGQGTRLRPLTETRPKPILPVLDRPCLSYLIESFARGGIEEVILACGYRSDQMVEAIGDGSDLGIDIEYSYEDEPMGTGGAIKLLEGRLDDTFVAANGDVFADIDLSEQVAEHFRSGAAVTISLTPVGNPTEFGTARIGDDGRITEFKEKPKPEEVFSNLINAGVYVVERRVMALVPEGKPYDFSKDLFPLLMGRGERLQGHTLKGAWRDVGRPSDLIGANLVAATKAGSFPGVIDGAETEAPVYVGKGSRVVGGSLSGSVVMASCGVSGSNIRGSIVFPGCDVEGSDIIDSVLGEGCVVPPGCVIKGCVLGDGTMLERGTILDGVRVP
ncbi:MAG: NDP-sugar synthase [Thermoplasmatales archaeon]|nr:NDP-sugar synthase [Thermoplasmatales archaeon]